MRSRIVPLSLLFLMAASAFAQEDGPRGPGGDGDKTQSPYFLVQGGDADRDGFPLKETGVEAAISGVVAEVKVTQTYKNSGKAPLNARYVFPASTRAAIHGMTMKIGDEAIAAKIEERKKAQADFDSAKTQGKGASLLTQQRPNVFTMDVANVMPGEEVKVELRYTELLVPEEGVYEFVFPTVVGPRYTGAGSGEKWTQNPYLKPGQAPPEPPRFRLHVDLAAGMPIQEIACPSHKTLIKYQGPDMAGVDLDESEKTPQDRDFILRYGLKGKRIESGLLLSQGKDEKHFLLMVQPPRLSKEARLAAGKVLPREYVFVLDVSGSMDGFPLATARKLMGDLIGQLTPMDKFNLVLFAGNAAVYDKRSVAATPDHMQAALEWIDNAKAGGGTELKAALETALALPKDENMSRSVVVITDGYISAEHEVFELIAKARGRANVFAFGIGSSVNRYLIEGIAKAGMGEPFVVTGPDEAGPMAEKFRDYILWPVLTGIQVKYEGFGAYDLEPESVPDLMAERPILIQGKWKGKNRGTITITGKTADGDFTAKIPVGASQPEEKNSALRYLWARTRIASLSDFHNGAIDDDRREKITAIGLAYNLMTEFTSFVAVTTEVKNNSGLPADDVKQPLPLPQHVPLSAVGGRSVPEPEMGWLIMIIAVGAVMVYGIARLPPRLRAGFAAGAVAFAGLTLFLLARTNRASASPVTQTLLPPTPIAPEAVLTLPAAGGPTPLPEPGLGWLLAGAGLAMGILHAARRPGGSRRLGLGDRLRRALRPATSLPARPTRLPERLSLDRYFRPPQAVFLAAAAALFLLIKHHYSAAAPEAVRWMMTPVAFCVEALTRAGFRWREGIGYVTQDGTISIVKACAGVNFFLMVFALLACLQFRRVKSWAGSARALALSLLFAFAGALLANTLRIWIAIRLYRGRFSWGGLSPEELHRMEGVLVYFMFLWAIYSVAERSLAARRLSAEHEGEA